MWSNIKLPFHSCFPRHINHSIVNLSPLYSNFLRYLPPSHPALWKIPDHLLHIRLVLEHEEYWFWEGQHVWFIIENVLAGCNNCSCSVIVSFWTSARHTNNRTRLHLVNTSQMLLKYPLITCRTQTFGHQSTTRLSSIPACWMAWPEEAQTDTPDNKDHLPLMCSAGSPNTLH